MAKKGRAREHCDSYSGCDYKGNPLENVGSYNLRFDTYHLL